MRSGAGIRDTDGWSKKVSGDDQASTRMPSVNFHGKDGLRGSSHAVGFKGEPRLTPGSCVFPVYRTYNASPSRHSMLVIAWYTLSENGNPLALASLADLPQLTPRE
jgi:hypothetical protein